MATFTMNSQKTFTQAPKAKNIFDRAFAFSIALIVIVGGLWAAEHILIYLLNRQIAEYQATTSASLASVQAEDVQKVHNVTARLAAIDENKSAAKSAGELLSVLEKATIPQVRLTEYEYKSDGSIAISGIAADYRFLAEQILRYRQEPTLATAEVGTTGRTDNGQISFDIDVQEAKQEEALQQPAVPMATPPAL